MWGMNETNLIGNKCVAMPKLLVKVRRFLFASPSLVALISVSVKYSCIGSYKATPIDPSLFQPVKLSSYERVAFYITLATPNMRYTKVNEGKAKVGDIANDLPDIRVLVGSGVVGEISFWIHRARPKFAY